MMASSAYRLARKAWKSLNVEHKEVLTVITNTAPELDTTGEVVLLSGIDQGITASTRTGDEVRITSVSGKFVLNTNASSTLSQARLIVFWDKQSNGALPTVAEVLTSANTHALYNADNCPSRFKIIYDKWVGLSSTGERMKTFRFYRKLGHKATFTGTGNGIADVAAGAIYILGISNEATNKPGLGGTIRVAYLDN